ncbi:hypothetical protein CLV96_0008 [Leptospira meyeri]|uniref:Uncharacterized protein n=1 Tax=Leptospira meyeri TaxID=29508 RepID=A0A4R8MPI7_LEPME|nr:hypothetical protein CLV96_0008 [Leptospira meyeri]
MYAISLSTLSRYKLFETHRLFPCGESKGTIYRFILGIAINILGLNILIFGYNLFTNVGYSYTSLFSACIWSYSFLSFNRIVHAITATKLIDFFFDEEDKVILQQSYNMSKNNNIYAHLIPGLGYLVIPILFPILLLISKC